MRLRLFMFAILPIMLTGLSLGCKNSTEPKKTSDGQSDPRSTDAGSPLYAPVAAPTYPPVVNRRESIIIPNALVTNEERQVISAEVDGAIEVFATYYEKDEKIDDRLVYHPRDMLEKVKLKRLTEGDEVKAGQTLAFMDDRQIAARRDGSIKTKEAGDIALKHAIDGADSAEKRTKILMVSVAKGVGSVADLIDAQLTEARFRENEANARQTIAKAEAELAETTVLLDKHKIRTRVNGVIRNVAKRPGEFVKAGEKIMEIEATDRVRIEGQLDVQYALLISRGMMADVEPAMPSAPIASHEKHRRAVTGLAVTAHPDGPLVVSVGADGNALVWEPNLGKKPNRPSDPHKLPHPEGVDARSVAATPPAAKMMLVITGADDGKLRIWDVSNRDRLPTTPKAEPTETHSSAVQSIAISPDGRFFASSDGRDVFVWDLVNAKKLYSLAAEHRDTITAVSFTPQSTLITASKDGTLKVWKLGAERAVVARTIDHRAGVIDVLGVSRDGARVLFDQDKNRIDLVDPASSQTVGQIGNVSSAGSFSTLAIFGPDEVSPNVPVEQLPPYTIATAGGDGDLKGMVQYWQAPRTGGRGTEVGRLITPSRVPITAAAFSPVRAEQFLVVGTSNGGVFLWKPPTEARKTNKGRITLIDQTDTRYMTVRVEMANPLKLPDHSSATIIITPTNP
jgi:WD40 repeat protein/biotin carboxyl carrier protein